MLKKMGLGGVLDDDDGRFVVLTFEEPGGDPVVVTFTVPIFQHCVGHLVSKVDANWR